MTTEPTVGCVVHYWPGKHDFVRPALGTMSRIDPEQPFVATVVFVHSPTTVNLVVTDHYGNMLSRPRVPFGRSTERSGWEWPQIKPAAEAAA
jgi:hypothetical protein